MARNFDILIDSRQIKLSIRERLKELNITGPYLCNILDIDYKRFKKYMNSSLSKDSLKSNTLRHMDVVNVCKFIGIEPRLVVVELPKEKSLYYVIKNMKAHDKEDSGEDLVARLEAADNGTRLDGEGHSEPGVQGEPISDQESEETDEEFQE